MNSDSFMDMLDEGWVLGDRTYRRRLLHCYGNGPSHRLTAEQCAALIHESGTEILTIYTHGDLGRVKQLDDFPLGYGGFTWRDIRHLVPVEHYTVLVNLNHARSASESKRRADMARDVTGYDWLKLEVLEDNLLRPANKEVIAATEILRKDGYQVLPLIQANVDDARVLEDLGCLALRVTMSDIGSHEGMRDPDHFRRLKSRVSIPIIAEGGIGSPIDAFQAVATGADAVLINTAIFTARDPIEFIRAARRCVEAGRVCYLLDRLGADVEQWTQRPILAVAPL
jgi:thiazole synthase ThiGH ThiG subunit